MQKAPESQSEKTAEAHDHHYHPHPGSGSPVASVRFLPWILPVLNSSKWPGPLWYDRIVCHKDGIPGYLLIGTKNPRNAMNML